MHHNAQSKQNRKICIKETRQLESRNNMWDSDFVIVNVFWLKFYTWSAKHTNTQEQTQP